MMDSQIGSPSMESEPDDGLKGDWQSGTTLAEHRHNIGTTSAQHWHNSIGTTLVQQYWYDIGTTVLGLVAFLIPL